MTEPIVPERAAHVSSPGGLGGVVFAALFYLAIGLLFGALAAATPSNQARFFWRLSAFVASGVVFLVHVVRETLRARNGAQAVARRAALAVALGAAGLALSANIHDVGSASGYRPRMLVALIAWPILTAVPAFVVALAGASLLGRRRRTESTTAVR